MKPLLWILAAIAAAFLIISLTAPYGHPNEQQARHDFLAEHPTYTVERIALEEHEVVAVCYRIFYRIPGDPALHEEFRQYLHSDGQWRISHRARER